MSEWQPTQVERLTEIGMQLREQRCDRSIDLQEVAARIYIRASVLAALENGDVRDLPEPVYAKGLIRRYGDALGLEGMMLAEQFPVDSKYIISENRAPGASLTSKKVLLSQSMVRHRSFRSIFPRVSFPRRTNGKPVPTSFVMVVLGCFALGGLVLWSVRNLRPVNLSFAQLGALFSRSEAELRETQPEETASQSSQSNRDRIMTIAVSLTGQSWLRVTVDGKEAFEGELSEGDKQTWEVKDAITLEAGNAGAVMVSLNGKQAKPLGELGEVKEATFPSADASGTTEQTE